MTADRRLPVPTILVAITMALVLVCGVLLWVRYTGSPAGDVATGDNSSAPAAVALEPTERLSVLWVGDDFTAGAGGAARNAYPFILCKSRGWNCNVDAQNGTGFIDDGRRDSSTTAKLVDRLARDAELYMVDLVLVDAGRNDLDEPIAAVVSAVREFLARVSGLWPEARIAVVMPTFMSAEPYDDYAALRAAIQTVVDEFGGTLLDPIADGWYAGADIPALQISDGAHPNAPGHQLIAQQIGDSLDKRGLGKLGVANR